MALLEMELLNEIPQRGSSVRRLFILPRRAFDKPSALDRSGLSVDVMVSLVNFKSAGHSSGPCTAHQFKKKNDLGNPRNHPLGANSVLTLFSEVGRLRVLVSHLWVLSFLTIQKGVAFHWIFCLLLNFHFSSDGRPLWKAVQPPHDARRFVHEAQKFPHGLLL